MSDRAIANRNTEITSSEMERNFDEVSKKTALLEKFIKDNLKDKIDYGQASEHAGGKPTLLKPGSEKICLLLNLRPTFEKDISILSELSPLIREETVCLICRLVDRKSKAVVGEGRASCSIWKMQKGIKILDVNRGIKMAQKRAQMDAVLRVAALSGRFTQDMEDDEYRNVKEAPPPPRAFVEQKKPTVPIPAEKWDKPTVKPDWDELRSIWNDYMRVFKKKDGTGYTEESWPVVLSQMLTAKCGVPQPENLKKKQCGRFINTLIDQIEAIRTKADKK